MSVVLGKLLGRGASANKAVKTAQQEDTAFRKHVDIVEHEVADRYYGHDHDHSNGRDDNDHKHRKRLAGERLNSNSPTTTPSFMLYLWSALPILLLAFSSSFTVIFIAMIATLINFFIIQMRVHTSKRYVASGIVSFIALSIYLAMT